MMKKRNLSVDRERISWLIETYRRPILDSTVPLQHVPVSITNKILAIVSEKNVVLDIWSQADWLIHCLVHSFLKLYLLLK